MVLLSEVDGKISIYRNVKHKDFPAYVEGFFALRHYQQNGKLYQLIGKERRLLRVFGTMKVNDTI